MAPDGKVRGKLRPGNKAQQKTRRVKALENQHLKRLGLEPNPPPKETRRNRKVAKRGPKKRTFLTETQIIYCEHLARGVKPDRTMDMLGISRSMYYSWRKNDLVQARVAKIVETMRGSTAAYMERAHIEIIDKGLNLLKVGLDKQLKHEESTPGRQPNARNIEALTHMNRQANVLGWIAGPEAGGKYKEEEPVETENVEDLEFKSGKDEKREYTQEEIEALVEKKLQEKIDAMNNAEYEAAEDDGDGDEPEPYEEEDED